MTVALVTESHELVERVRSVTGADQALVLQPWRNGQPFNAERIVSEVGAETASVVCIGDDVPLDLAIEVAAVADRDHRAEMSVVLVANPSNDLWRDAVRAGVRDIVDPHLVDVELEPALGRAVAWTARLRESGWPPPPPPPPPPPKSGRVIVVLSPKGGSGKTMVASNLTAALARDGGGAVALVDLDVQFGDAGYAFGLVAEHTIGQLAASPTLDATTLKVFLTRHEPSGAYVLCGAESPEEGESVTDEVARQIVELLARDVAYVVVDTPAGLDERTLAVLELATDVVLVSSLDVSSIRNLGKSLDALDRVGLLPRSRHFVLNRSDARVGIDPSDVEAALGMKIDTAVPSSRAIPFSMNQGSPIVIEDPKSQAARELTTFTQRFVDADATEAAPEPRSGFLRRRKDR
ncbi:MAG TPA: P-loop NTPase [Acidimicrobiales bacterium]|nr:P-loop NTPase [Acidimicrobiales bacterium]